MRRETLLLRVTADPRYARAIREEVLHFAYAWKMRPADVEEFVTAIGEAFANAVEHAHTLDPITIGLRADAGDKLLATVTDFGVGFDTRRAEGVLPPPGTERGRGFALMRRYCDLVSIRSQPGEGTSVMLGRYLRASRDEQKGRRQHAS